MLNEIVESTKPQEPVGMYSLSAGVAGRVLTTTMADPRIRKFGKSRENKKKNCCCFWGCCCLKTSVRHSPKIPDARQYQSLKNASGA